MVPSPRPRLTGPFKILAATLITINVTWHGTVALFIGGPLGLALFLCGVVGVWVWSWRTMRRWQSEDEQPDPIRTHRADEHDRLGKPQASSSTLR